MRSSRLAAFALVLAGCEFGPVSLDGRVCSADSDCIAGYVCSEERLCELGLDSGPPDAARPDAARPDAARPDAHLDPDAALDAASGTADAPVLDAAFDALDAPGGVDAAPLADAAERLDAPGLDAPGLDAPGLDAPALDAPALDAQPPDDAAGS
jgi:hypothetical protein